ncbi:MAG TPA: hypothetical protein VF444_05655 [Pseudonocardiaceae bacterium]
MDNPGSGPNQPQPSDLDSSAVDWFGVDHAERIEPLPKRVPRRHMQENLVEGPQPFVAGEQPLGRDAQRARSVMHRYQSGVQACRRDLTGEAGEQPR